jgi:hypothetical protein
MKQLQNVLSFLFLLAFSASANAQYASVNFTQSSADPSVYASLNDYSATTGINAVSASLSNNKINLTWSIPAYGEAAQFVIERSLDGEHFDMIGSDATAMLNNDKKSFTYTDKPGNKLMHQGDIFYRLGSLNENNEYQYTKPIMVRVNTKGIVDYITVFPHPKENDINLILGLKENGYYTAKLRNEQGQEIMVRKGNVKTGQQQLALKGTNQLKRGNYWLELTVDSKEALTMKLIKE